MLSANGLQRKRSTKAEMAERYEALIQIVNESAPTGVRFVYYRGATQHITPKSDSGYNKVQRALVHLRKPDASPTQASLTPHAGCGNQRHGTAPKTR